jgi:hypothetical protein
MAAHRQIVLRGLFVGSALLAGAAWCAAQTGVAGKSKAAAKSKTNVTAVRQLDTRVQQLQEQLLKDALDIAKGYEDNGEFDRAKWMLEVLEKLDPKLPGLQAKIDQLKDKSLNSSEFEYELDVSRGWSPPLGMVVKDRVARIEAVGDYQFVTALTVTGDGLPMSDTGTDLVGGVPVGALIGVLINPETRKPGKPFEIKAKREWTPRESGLLQLKVNVPNGHKCTGKLTIKLGGIGKL